MEQKLLTKLCEISKNTTDAACESEFRNSMQDIFNNIYQERKTCLGDIPVESETFFTAQSLLKQFYNFHYSALEVSFQTINLTELCKAIAFCSDIIAVEWNRRVFFLGGDIQICASCCERQITWALMSLIANAVMYSDKKYIGISLRETENSVIFSVENCGLLDAKKYFNAFSQQKSSVYSIKNIAHKHGGTLVCYCTGTNVGDRFVKFSMSIELKERTEDIKVCNNDKKMHLKNHSDFISEFLDNRLSPLYTAFCELLY